MRTLLVVVVVVVVVTLSGCLSEGAQCEGQTLITCETDESQILRPQSALWCNLGTVTRYDCARGCANGVCDFSGSRVGSPCPRSTTGQGWCESNPFRPEENGLVVCDGTSFKKVPCSDCRAPNGSPGYCASP